MPAAVPLGKRLVPTSTMILPDEISDIQSAARAKQITMSQFIRSAAVRDARRVLRRVGLRPLAKAS